jgi:glutamate-1-semialdehyde 2,1-aminomutase
VGAFGGRKAIMEKIAPLGPVYQAGTLSGNPVSMAAGLATLKLIQAPGFHDKLSQTTAMLCDGLKQRARAAGIPLATNQVGGMFGIFFTGAEKITSFKQVTECNIERFKAFFHAMLNAGVYLAPSAYEAGFVSAAHTSREINATLDAAEKVFGTLR